MVSRVSTVAFQGIEAVPVDVQVMVAPGKMGGHRKRMLEPHRAFIVERINQTPHLTLHGLKDELALRGVQVSHDTVWQFLRHEGLRFKKNAVRP